MLFAVQFQSPPLVMRLIRVVVCCYTGLFLAGNAPRSALWARRSPAVGPFLDNVMPESAPTISVIGQRRCVHELTFTNAIGLTYVPGTSKLVVWEARRSHLVLSPTILPQFQNARSI